MSGYRSGGGPSRVITKPNTAGATSLTGTTPVAPAVPFSSGVYGSYAQVVASASSDTCITSVAARVQVSGPTSLDGPIFVDVAVGGAGSEVVVGTAVINGTMIFNNAAFLAGHVALPVPLRVSSGQRVAVRAALGFNTLGTPSVSVWLTAVPTSNLENS